MSAVDRVSAARVLGVHPDASAAEVDAAYRARVRERHPDLVPTGSPEWDAATRAMHALNDARAALTSTPPTSTPSAVDATGASRSAPPTEPAPVPWSRQTVGPLDLVPAYRRERQRGYVWGVFLLLAAVGSYLIGAASPPNNAVPVWSPALAVIGAVSLVLGWRADRRLREAQRRASPDPG